MNFWIVLVNYNGLEDSRKCLRSLESIREPFSVVLTDNASNDDPLPKLKPEFPWVHYLQNPVNGGWSGGNNTGIRYALEHGATQLFLLNNDTTVRPDIVARLQSAAAARPDCGILGPVIRYMDEPELVMTDGVMYNRPPYPGFFQRLEVPECEAEPPHVADVDIVNGCAMMVRADVFRRIGLIDDRFFLLHEEADFCLRAKAAGFNCGVLAEGMVWHKGSSTFKRVGKHLQRYFDTRNLGLLLSKQTHYGRGTRGALASYVTYLRYAYHRYCHEREEGHKHSADAVIEGLVDLATRRFGVYKPRRRWALPVVRCAFDAARRVKPKRSASSSPIDKRKDLWDGRAQA